MHSLRALPFVLLLLASPALGEFPYPSNPAPCTRGAAAGDCIEARQFHRYLFLPATDPPTLPNDFNNNWKLSSQKSGFPEIDSNPQELFGITGASVDLAWQVTTGRPDVIIAVLDSGIRWGEAQPDLVNKFYLNRGELPVPEGSRNQNDPYDRNGDGVFDIRDYLASGGFARDSRVSDQNGSGMIDPEDLIFLFSDGVDDDGNGYTDDISGWDFWEDDNDPLDEVRYGHGTGESQDSGAEANNGRGEVGTCPNCLLLEVRVADSFVAEVNHFAQGVLFAVDSGARVVQEALGTVNHSRFAQAALDYAYRNGTVVIASAADEQSSHNNYPAVYNHTVEVNSVTRFFDEGGFTQTPRSYLYLNGCTNYGGHIHLSVPSTGCSSEATGLSSGMAGLVISAALNEIERGNLTPYPGPDGTPQPFALSAEEIKQILTLTADDIDFDARPDLDPPLPQNYATDIPLPGLGLTHSRFPSIAGWDQYFGYGRINASRAVRRVREGRIPPEAAFETPSWFAYLQPAAQAVALTGRAAARRARSFSYSVAVAPGVQPPASAFVEIYRSPQLATDFEGTLATLDLAQVAALLPNGPAGPPVAGDGSGRIDPERFTFTVRLQVTDDRGQLAEDRRTLYLHDDPQLVPGFPLQLTSDGASPPLPADLDGDGIDELLLATSDGVIHALRLDGSQAPGWPVTTDPLPVHQEARAFSSGAVPVPHAAIIGELAAGDLDGDGSLEVVAADLEGWVYVWSSTGVRRAGFPVSTLPQYSHSRRSERDPRTPEGLVPDRINRKTRDNRLARGISAGPVLVNLDSSPDGSLEIVVGALDRHLYAWTHRGAPVPGWPVMLRDPAKVQAVDPVTDEVTLVPGANAVIGSKIVRSPAAGDLDGDHRPEIVAVVNEGYRERPNAIFDGVLINFLIAGGLLRPGNTRVYAVHADGTRHGANPIDLGWNPDAFVSGWPVKTALLQTELLPVVGTGSNGAPALADLDGDGLPEIATFSAVGPLYLFDGRGRSFLGTARNVPIVLAQQPFGSGSNSSDFPTFGGLGGPAVAELRGPGTGFHVVAPTAGLGKLIDLALPAMQLPADNHLTAWSIDRHIEENFPRQTQDLQFFVVPTVADITGDGLPEVMTGTGVRDLHAVDVHGAVPSGWPKFTAGWTVSPPAVADLDGDGKLEVAHVTREGFLFVWRTDGGECGYLPWPHARHDLWGTSNFGTDARSPATAQRAELVDSAPGGVRFRLAGMPGDDLFCGEARYEVRFSAEGPITEESFARAIAAAQVQAGPPGRGGGELRVADQRLVRGTFHFAAIVRDEAGNRSRLIPLGEVSFGDVTPTVTASATAVPSATATATPVPTATGVPTATATASVVPTATATVEATATREAVATATRSPTAVTPVATLGTGAGSGGCALAGEGGSAVDWWGMWAALFWLLVRRWRVGWRCGVR